MNLKGASKDGGAVKEMRNFIDGTEGTSNMTRAGATASSLGPSHGGGKGQGEERDMLQEVSQWLKSLKVPMAKAAM